MRSIRSKNYRYEKREDNSDLKIINVIDNKDRFSDSIANIGIFIETREGT